MDSVTLFLLAVAGIFVIGAVGEVIFQRTNVPDVIWLILAGILLGPVAGVVTKDRLAVIAPYFAAITLVVVLFEGGTALRLSELSKAAPRSGLLAAVTFSFSTVATCLASMLAAAVGWLPDAWTWTHGWMLGAILGGSSSIIVMPAMSQAKVEPDVANLVNLESALTDALCVVGTTALIDVMMGGSTSGSPDPLVTLLRSFGIGLVVGVVAGFFWILLLRFLEDNEHAYPITLSVLLVLYVVIDHMGGSAAFGILTVAVILGNAGPLSKKIGLVEEVQLDTSVRGFHRQMAFIIKSFFFVFIGAMLGPPWSLVLLGVLLGAVLFAARIPGVRLASLGSALTAPQRRLVSVAMPRGMAAGVLATLPVARGVPGTDALPVVVFACVFTTILVFAVGFPMARRAAPSVPEPPPTAPSAPEPPPAGASAPDPAATAVEQAEADRDATAPREQLPVAAQNADDLARPGDEAPRALLAGGEGAGPSTDREREDG